MLSSGFGKRPKHKKFDYIPRYYDENKERLSALVDQHSGDPKDQDKLKSRISSGLRQRYVGDESYRKSNIKKSNIRVIYILLVLCFVSYLILRSTGIQKMIESFS